jgi:hypothetical protein
MDPLLAVDELAEVLVGGQQHRVPRVRLLEGVVVRHARGRLGDVKHLAIIPAQPLHDRPIDAFINDKVHADFVVTG